MTHGDDESARQDRPEDRVDLAVYAFAALALIGLGVAFQAWVLNWIVGPALVVTIVVVATPIAHRYADRRARR